MLTIKVMAITIEPFDVVLYAPGEQGLTTPPHEAAWRVPDKLTVGTTGTVLSA